MIFARGTAEGEKVAVTRSIRHRLRDHEALAARDLLMLEWSLRGWTQERIAQVIRCDRSLVSRRLESIPDALTRALIPLVRRHPDGIPGDCQERLLRGLLDHRQRLRDRARADRHARA